MDGHDAMPDAIDMASHHVNVVKCGSNRSQNPKLSKHFFVVYVVQSASETRIWGNAESTVHSLVSSPHAPLFTSLPASEKNKMA
jgi:hypothetical protein